MVYLLDISYERGVDTQQSLLEVADTDHNTPSTGRYIFFVFIVCLCSLFFFKVPVLFSSFYHTPFNNFKKNKDLSLLNRACQHSLIFQPNPIRWIKNWVARSNCSLFLHGIYYSGVSFVAFYLRIHLNL